MIYLDLTRVRPEPPDRVNFRPWQFSAGKKEDIQELKALVRRSGAIAEVHDTLIQQIREWVKARTPRRKLTEAEYQRGIQDYLDGRTLEETGNWIYYPWSRKLVRLLEEEDFAFLRTAANRHKITEEEQALLQTKKVGVVGMSVGQSVAMILAQERGFGEIRLADFDQLELNNLNRIRARVSDLGYPKVVSIAREIAELDPYLRVTIFDQGVREENIESFFTSGGKLDLVIDECDSVDIKILIRIWAKKLSVPVLMEASDRGTLDVERFDLEPQREIMHGWLSGLDLDMNFLKTLKTAEEKLPYILPISGLETLSPRMKASMLEIETSLTTWPQLASAVQLGGALTADTCRRIFLDQFRESGRYHIDLEELIPASFPQNLPPSAPHGTDLEPDWNEYIRQVPLEEGGLKDPSRWRPLIEAALWAPSIGNMQPWKWVIRQGRFYLFHDRRRSKGDFLYMGAMVSLGAALENLFQAAHGARIGLDYQLFPLGADSPLIACGRFLDGLRGEPLIGQEALASWIGERGTNRRLGPRVPLSDSLLDYLSSVMESLDPVRLHICRDPRDLDILAEVIAEAERRRLLDPEGHRSFFEEELRWNSGHARETGDGVDLDSLDLSPSERAALRLLRDSRVSDLLRQWDRGEALGDLGRAAVNSASAMGLVSLPALDPEPMIRAGRAIERYWLAATKESLSLQPMLAAVYPISRIRHGGAGTMEPNMIRAFQRIHEQLLNVFPDSRGREAVFLFRLAKVDKPLVKSFRRKIGSTVQTEEQI